MAKFPKFNNSPFIKPLTRKQWRREARAMARLRYRPEIRAIRGEERASKRRQQQIRKWFDQYGQTLSDSAQRTSQAYAGAERSIAQDAQAAAAYAEQLRQRLAQEGMRDAALRGASYDPSGSEVNVQAQLARLNAANVLKGVTAAQGASQGAYLADRARIAERESITQRMREQERRRQLAQERRALRREQGEYMASLRPAAREAERNFYLGLLAARDRRAQRRFEARQAAKDRAFRASEAAKDRAFRAKQAAKDRRFQARQNRRDRRQERRKKRGDIDPADVRRAISLLEEANRRQQRRHARNRRKAISGLLRLDKSLSLLEARRAYRRWLKRYKRKRRTPGEAFKGGKAKGKAKTN